MGSRTKSLGRTRLAKRRKRLVAAEGAVLIALIALALSVQWFEHSMATVALDLAVLALGGMGLAFAISEPGYAGRWWQFLVFGVPTLGAVVQLFWTAGMTEAFVLLLLLPMVFDGLADLFLLAASPWQRRQRRNPTA